MQSGTDPRLSTDPLIKAELDRVFGESPVIEASERAAEKVAGWSKDKKHYAARVLPPTQMRPGVPIGDNVVLPRHYARFAIEPIRFIAENQLNFFQGNIVKYILRHDAKNGLEDVRKAARYCRMFERYLMGDPDWNGPDPQPHVEALNRVREELHKGTLAMALEPEQRGAVLAAITKIEADMKDGA